jgi:hypothetical protein
MKKKVSIALGSDHAGFVLKQKIINFLQENNRIFHDFGTHFLKILPIILILRIRWPVPWKTKV